MPVIRRQPHARLAPFPCGADTIMRSVALALVTLMLLGTRTAVQEPQTLGTDKERLSYALGMDLGKQLRAKSVDVEVTVFARGLADALAGDRLLLTDEESKKLVAALQDELQRRELVRVAETAEKNKREGEGFLAVNKTKEAIVTLPSGLQYRIVTAGTGRRPTANDTVICHYRGTFIDGTEFDSSQKPGQPATFPVNGVIKGWQEALQLMPVGSRWQLFIPSELAYGSRGAGDRIGPNATLIFELELIAIK
jgi:FKBP-type peptidyl-prolyl cis-trans isomerase FklB